MRTQITRDVNAKHFRSRSSEGAAPLPQLLGVGNYFMMSRWTRVRRIITREPCQDAKRNIGGLTARTLEATHFGSFYNDHDFSTTWNVALPQRGTCLHANSLYIPPSTSMYEATVHCAVLRCYAKSTSRPQKVTSFQITLAQNILSATHSPLVSYPPCCS
jgi:hypothetical protein